MSVYKLFGVPKGHLVVAAINLYPAREAAGFPNRMDAIRRQGRTLDRSLTPEELGRLSGARMAPVAGLRGWSATMSAESRRRVRTANE
jgi:hypothetical protein